MEENKYYIPEISEFFVGFRYLFRRSLGVPYESYEITEHASFSLIQEAIYNDFVKVKYLSKEDIEEEGCVFDKKHGKSELVLTFKKQLDEHRWVEIDTPESFDNEDTHTVICIHTQGDVQSMFQGDIKNRSELKRILKMIGV